MPSALLRSAAIAGRKDGYGYRHGVGVAMEEVDEKGKQTGTKALLLRREELSHTSAFISHPSNIKT